MMKKVNHKSSLITFKNSAGLRKTPTPGGVPVRMVSPGVRVKNLQYKGEKGFQTSIAKNSDSPWDF